MLNVVLTSFFIIKLVELTRFLVNSFYVLILYLEPWRYTMEMAEWLWRWTPDQTFVGSNNLADDFLSVSDLFF